MELRAGHLEVEPLALPQVRAASIDLTLDEVARVYRDPPSGVHLKLSEVDISTFMEWAGTKVNLSSSPVELKRGDCVVIGYTKERVKLPSFLSGRVEGRSGFARLGLSVHNTAPTIQPGFNGQIALELTNNGPYALTLEPGLVVCQLILERMAHPSSGYSGQFQDQVARL
jgi:dCTP deaminase